MFWCRLQTNLLHNYSKRLWASVISIRIKVSVSPDFTEPIPSSCHRGRLVWGVCSKHLALHLKNPVQNKLTFCFNMMQTSLLILKLLLNTTFCCVYRSKNVLRELAPALNHNMITSAWSSEGELPVCDAGPHTLRSYTTNPFRFWKLCMKSPVQ